MKILVKVVCFEIFFFNMFVWRLSIFKICVLSYYVKEVIDDVVCYLSVLVW